MWPRCDELVAAARSGDLVAVRRLLDAGVPVIATDRHMSTALFEATSIQDGQIPVCQIVPGSITQLVALMKNHFAVAEELLERGFPICFGGGGPSLVASAMFQPHGVVAVPLLLKYGTGREFEGAAGKQLLDNARDYASGVGPFAVYTPAARLVMAATSCHPGKVRSAIKRLRRLAPVVGRAARIFMALYTEVKYRPGGEGERAAKASFDACLSARDDDK